MCYGKLTLSFQFKATEDPKRKTSTEESASMGSGIQLDFIGGEDGSTDPNQLSPGDEPQAHKLVRTHFKTSTVCGYCNKRVSLLPFLSYIKTVSVGLILDMVQRSLRVYIL